MPVGEYRENYTSPLTPLPWERGASAFTLAEVLITLVIIGVIAAITVPSLINKTNNQEYVSKLKKAYSTLAQATNLIIAEEGPVKTWTSSRENVYNLYKKHLLNAKECSNSSGCWQQNITRLNGNPDTSWNYRTDMYKMILADGTQVMIENSSSNCNYSNLYDNGSNNFCAQIFVDINGLKKPNVYGRDIFEFVLKPNGLHPAGCDIDICDKSHWGRACACKILREGAMNY